MAAHLIGAWHSFLVPPFRSLSPLPPRLTPRGRPACGQLIPQLMDLLLGQARQTSLRRQARQTSLRRQARQTLLRRQRLENFPAVFGRQAFQGLALLLGRQLREMLLDILAREVLHRERHGKSLLPKSLEELPQQQA